MSSVVLTWGSDGYGRLGHGTENRNLQTPTQVKGLDDVIVKRVTCGAAHNIVVDNGGLCYSWGKCHYGQLGHGELDQDEHLPRLIVSLKGVAVDFVVGGDSHVLAVTKDGGQVYSWGLGYYGTLGHGDEHSHATPQLIQSLKDVHIMSVAAGANHNFAVSRAGRVYVWGRDHCGQLGLAPRKSLVNGVEKLVRLNQKTPVIKEFPEAIKTISACFNHTLVLLESGVIASYGCNDHYELGRGSHLTSNELQVPLIEYAHFNEPVSIVKAGWKHCAAITDNGILYMWGHGNYGRLGSGHCRDVEFPNKVVVGGGVKFRDVSCGESHTIALDVDGRLWGWGSNHYGKLGLSVDDGSYVDVPRLLRFQIEGLVGVCCGTNHSIAYRTV